MRVGLEAFGFIFLWGVYTNNINLTLFLVALGFSALDIFGGLYNDYYDYRLDLRNKRKDKWISAGLITKNQMLYLSGLLGFFGLVALYLANMLFFLIGLYYFFLAVSYSHPKIPIGRNLTTYFLVGAPYLLIFYVSTLSFKVPFTRIDIYYSLFAFFQAIYLITHKDINDTNDNTNIFLEKYDLAFLVCLLLGLLSSAFLLPLSANSACLLALWILNLFVLKLWLLKKIRGRTVKRGFRDNVVLFEFLTPYIYAIAILFGRVLT